MKEDSQTSGKAIKKSVSSRIVKWILWIFGALLTTILLAALLVFLLPRLVSTDWAKEKIQIYAAKAIHRPIHMQNLSWTWDGGILLEGLEIDDDPSFSDKPILSFNRFLLSVNYRQLLERRLAIIMELGGAHVNLIKNKGGLTNLDNLLSGISQSPTSPPKPEQKRSATPNLFPPPVRDIQARIRLDNLSLRMDDREQGRHFLVKDGSFLLDVPSLARKPINVSFAAGEEMDGKPLPPIRFKGKILDLISDESTLNIKGLSADIQGELPGLKISVVGSAARMDMQAELALDLEPLRNGVASFLSPTPPEVSGEMVLDLKASMDGTGLEEQIRYEMELNGRALKASGGPLKEKTVGPLTFRVTNTGIIRNKEDILEFLKGNIHIQNESDLSFRGTMGGLTKPPLKVDLLLDSVSLNLQELLSLAAPFVPAGISLNNGKETKGGQPRLEIRDAAFTGAIPAGPNHLTWENLELEMPFAESSLPGASAIAEGLHLNIKKGDVAMTAFSPTRTELTADLMMKSLHLNGKEPVSLKGLHIPRIHLLADDLSPSATAFFGLSGKIDLDQTLSLESVTLSNRVSIVNLLQTLNLRLILPTSPSLSVTAFALSASSPSIGLKDLPSGPVKSPFSLKTDVQKLEITKGKSFQIDMEKADIDLSAGNILQAHVKAHVVDSGMKELQADGNVAVDLAKAFPLLPPSLRASSLKGGKVSGGINVHWKYNGRRPTPKEVDRFMSKDIPLKERLQAAGFVETAEIETTLTDIRLNFPFGEGKALKVDKITTPKPIEFSLKNGLKDLNLEGQIVLEGIRDLPASMKIAQPVRAVLSLSGALDNLEALKLSQNLSLTPLGFNQSFTATLSGLDRFLEGTEKKSPENALKKLRGSLKVSLKANPGPELSPYLQALSIQGVDVSGTVNAAAGIEFDGNGGVTGRVQIGSPHLNMAVKDRLRIKDLKMAVDLEKKLKIITGKETKHNGQAPSPYLSVKVLDLPFSGQTTPDNRSQNPQNRYPMGDLRAPFARTPTLAFDSLHVKMDPFPLDLTDFALHLQLKDSLPVVDSFQFDVLGGTWVGDISLSHKKEGSDDRYLMKMDGSFTGIDTAKLAPGTQGTDPEGTAAPVGETELAGNISLRLPISTDPDVAMNNFGGVVRLTHIGSRTLERFLYALDPSESNEMIRKQRSILRQGTPLWITVEIRSGNLSLTGEVLVKGARITLPTIQRLNITALPLRKKLQKAFSSLGPVVNALKAMGANTIVMDEGKIKLETR